MRILITGACGFIGFHLTKKLLKKKKYKVYGIDNFDDYYSISLKKKRKKELLNYNNFLFYKIDIKNSKKLEQVIKSNKIDIIFHLAAQAGVRYSIKNPKKYIENNIVGFYNLIDIAKRNRIQKIFYASSSSVYGDSKKFPLKENDI